MQAYMCIALYPSWFIILDLWALLGGNFRPFAVTEVWLQGNWEREWREREGGPGPEATHPTFKHAPNSNSVSQYTWAHHDTIPTPVIFTASMRRPTTNSQNSIL